MDEIKAKQQVVEKIKEAGKILITVSDNPTVDALSAALGLTLLLDKQEKYATAIFSGETPPAIAFLEPEKTFDDTTDSLRDFIIALNKEKADHLRYKVVDDAVKIFITPYKTTIDESDLEFSQGDYNVELVIALGVDNQDHLDGALENHGQILHDAAIVTLTAGDQSSDLGGIDWHDASASSLSEMIAGLAEALKEDKKKSLLDAPIATALLTGIVAETDRFSNEHTTSRAMTVAATLMAGGADQQLIATELQASHEIGVKEPAEAEPEADDDSSDVEVDKDSSDGSTTIKHSHDSTALAIDHEGESLADLDRRVRGEKKAKQRVIAEVAAAEEVAAEAEAQEEAQADLPPAPEPYVAPAPAPEAIANSNEAPEPVVGSAYAAEEIGNEPVLGGTLNATTEQAADDARREIENDQNKTILSHSYIGSTDAPGSSVAASSSLEGGVPSGFPGTPPAAPGSVAVNEVPSGSDVHSAYAFDDEPVPGEPTIAVGGERVIQPISEPSVAASAYAAPTEPPVADPASAYAPAPEATPADLGLPLPPPIPDFSQMNSAPAIPVPPVGEQPAILGDILAPEPAPALDYELTNAVPMANTAYAPEPELPQQAPVAPDAPQNNPSDPTQFQIPPQQ